MSKTNTSLTVTPIQLSLLSLQKKIEVVRKGKGRIPFEVKQQIVEATKHLSCQQVAEQFGLSKSTISRWRKALLNSATSEKRTTPQRKIRWMNERGAITLQLLQKVAATAFTMLIVMISTYLLILEAKIFYLQDSNPSLATLKAVIAELIILYIAFLRPMKRGMVFIQISILTLLLGHSAMTVSGVVLSSAHAQNLNLKASDERINGLQQELAIKREMLEYYRLKDWPSAVLKLDKEKTSLLNDLTLAQVEQRGTMQSTPKNESLILLLLFRVVLLISNIFLTHQLRGFFERLSVLHRKV